MTHEPEHKEPQTRLGLEQGGVWSVIVRSPDVAEAPAPA